MLIYQIIVTGGVFFLLFHLLINLAVFRRPKSQGQIDQTISVLIPARDEERSIRACLESLVRQRATILEILVLDDHSQDATASIIEAWSRRDPRIKRLAGEDLPDGWTGKAWACQQLARAAKGQVLVFTDADTIHDQECVSSAVGTLLRKNADMISLWPYQKTKTMGEKLVVPFVHILLLLFLPHWMPGKWRSLGAANGQFIAFRRSAYETIGGHQAVKGHMVDDVSLARLAKAAGLKVINADGSRLVTCRMYDSLPAIWEGFSKNLRAGCDGSTVAFLALQGIMLVCLLLPFFWFVVGLVSGAEWTPWVCLQIIAIILIRVVLIFRVRHSVIGGALHPVGQLLELAIAMNSWWMFSQRKIEWKGRTYSGV